MIHPTPAVVAPTLSKWYAKIMSKSVFAQICVRKGCLFFAKCLFAE